MRVCSIEKTEGKILFNGDYCASAAAAYQLFRAKYNKALGTANHLKFGHVGQRVERITRVGIDFDSQYMQELQDRFGGTKKVRYYILGLVGSVYCRSFGSWDFDTVLEQLDDEGVEEYLDWLMCAGFKNARLHGRRDQVGRTNIKNYNNGRRKHKKECNAGQAA